MYYDDSGKPVEFPSKTRFGFGIVMALFTPLIAGLLIGLTALTTTKEKWTFFAGWLVTTVVEVLIFVAVWNTIKDFVLYYYDYVVDILSQLASPQA